MAEIKKINHIAFVVEDIESALKFWRDIIGIPVDYTTQIPEEQSLVSFLSVGDSDVELVQPTSENSGIAKFLAKRGPGMHHICLEVDDIKTLIEKLKNNGIQMINESPVERKDGRLYAFIHPKSANGVLVELYQLAPLIE